MAIAPHQEFARASSKLIPPKEEKKTAIEQLTNSTTFEVEFSDRNGRTFESIGLRPEQIMALQQS